MRIPEETIDRIRQAADILEVVGEFVSLKKRGSNYIACCPFHNEKSPSFNVNPARGIYKCFGCGKAGDSVRFVMDIENVGYPEALRYLAKKYGIEIEEREQSPEEQLRQNERESLFIVLNFAKTFFQETMQQTDEGQSIGLSYFRERGFLNPAIETFELGYSLDKWDALRQEGQKRGYSLAVLEKAGLILQKEDGKVFDRFRARVMFPIHNVAGRVIAFGARILIKDKTQPKYLNSPETDVYHKSDVLYGIFQAKQAIRQTDVCYLTEGYTDVISLHQAGIQNVVASSGTSLTPGQIRLISRFTQNITILYDGDAAGIKAALRGLDLVLEEGMNLKLLLLPDGEDPDSYVQRVGAEAFKTYIETNAQDFIEFKQSQLMADAGQDPVRRAEAVSDVIQSVNKMPDALKRQTFLTRVSQLFRLDEQSVISESNRQLRKQQEKAEQDFLRDQERAARQQQNQPHDQPRTANGEPDFDALNALLAEAGIETQTEFLDDHQPPTTSHRKPKSPLAYQEQECLRLLVNYGQRELEPGFTLCQYMLSELHEVDFQTPPYNLMLTLFREAYAQGTILSATDFLYRSNESGPGSSEPTLQRETIDLTTTRHEISEGWAKHEIYVPAETDDNAKILSDAAFGNVLRIKKMVAEQKMADLKRQMATNEGDADAVLMEFMHYKRVDMEIAKLLGTVISG
jgi:DNA primase